MLPFLCLHPRGRLLPSAAHGKKCSSLGKCRAHLGTMPLRCSASTPSMPQSCCCSAAPRRDGQAAPLNTHQAQCRCSLPQDVTDKQHRGYFVDLFVRVSNAVAINMYTKAREEPL